jgi:hypothetical protein
VLEKVYDFCEKQQASKKEKKTQDNHQKFEKEMFDVLFDADQD